MERDPVCGVEDQAQAHVGGGVVNVAQQVHGLSAPFGPQLLVDLARALLLVGRFVRQRGAGKWDDSSSFLLFFFAFFFPTCLSR